MTSRSLINGDRDLHGRPFKARGSRVNRCDSCLMPCAHCICGFRRPSRSGLQFWLLMHRKEQYKPTNTGRLILDTVEGSRVSLWDRLNPPAELVQAIEADPDAFGLLFPDDAGTDQAPGEWASVRNDRPLTIIIPDGTWRQASRMVRKSPYLDRLPRIGLWHSATSQYQLRKSRDAHQLCTAEVAIEVLAACEHTLQADDLRQYFQAFNQGYSLARRGIRPEVDLKPD